MRVSASIRGIGPIPEVLTNFATASARYSDSVPAFHSRSTRQKPQITLIYTDRPPFIHAHPYDPWSSPTQVAQSNDRSSHELRYGQRAHRPFRFQFS